MVYFSCANEGGVTMDITNLPDIQLSDLQLFLAVERYGSFTKAGERLFITQSWVSKRISNLEDMLGFRLFDRTKREVALTPAGLILKQRLEGVTFNILNAIQAAQEVQSETTHSLRLGCLEWKSGVFIKKLEYFADQNPQIIVDLDLKPYHELFIDLSLGRKDLIFTFSHIHGQAASDEYSVLTFLQVPLVAYMHRNHRLAGKKVLEVEDLQDVPLLTLEERASSYHIDHIRQLFLPRNIRPVIAKYADDVSDHFGNVLMNKGILLASQYLMGESWKEMIACSPIRDVYYELVAIWKTNNSNPALKIFLETLPEIFS